MGGMAMSAARIASWATVIAIAALALSGCYEDQMRKQLAAQGCRPTYKEELPEMVYCGKACFRHRMREHFVCQTGERPYFDH